MADGERVEGEPVTHARERVRGTIVRPFLVPERELESHQLGHGLALELSVQLLVAQSTEAV